MRFEFPWRFPGIRKSVWLRSCRSSQTYNENVPVDLALALATRDNVNANPCRTEAAVFPVPTDLYPAED